MVCFFLTSTYALAADGLCAALQHAVRAAAPGSGPRFVTSYPGNAHPALAHSAFTYDNALAAIALVACGHTEDARLVGDALALAAEADRTFKDGRVRNAYRAGPAADPPLPPGWWDDKAGQWAEDPYQDGSATGNVVWAALALLTLHEATGEARYRDRAAGLMRWVADLMADPAQPGGYIGGFDGFDPAQHRLNYKATEHNIDAVAAFTWLARLTGDAAWTRQGALARGLVAAAWDGSEGRFRIGTGPDGRTWASGAALDIQLWPHLAIADAPADWRRSLAWVEARHAVGGGFDFNDDRDGVWIEGTAQAALTYRMLGQEAKAAAALATVLAAGGPDGLLYATGAGTVTTGLAVGPASSTDDFRYYHQPHVGATAWAVLAQVGWNPFTGRRIGGR
ncbi:hypothetical protein [Nitrospirillum iridis]|uniref:Methylaspartate ammonia-lyase n=1 Tax=Nitrospirillum iridis TaxID=765888 RepID=A0A7X0AX00_9PROT|nr:hypothetical protein [Nitrospirillum iridis]MBB6250645.1 hypothetical protein [Nitrospirillum iridis]